MIAHVCAHGPKRLALCFCNPQQQAGESIITVNSATPLRTAPAWAERPAVTRVPGAERQQRGRHAHVPGVPAQTSNQEPEEHEFHSRDEALTLECPCCPPKPHFSRPF